MRRLQQFPLERLQHSRDCQLPLWAGTAFVGGLIGSELGSRRLSTPAFRRLLGVVLIVAGAKLIFS